jgi:hypothetical protein
MRSVIATFVACLLTVSLVGLTGCVEDDVGVRCELNDWDPTSDETNTQLGLQALECESRICVAYRGGRSRDSEGILTGPRCTKPCESDDDCPQEAISGCSKFVCRIGARVGGVSCCKFCVCDDDASGSDPDADFCSDKPVKCPNI